MTAFENRSKLKYYELSDPQRSHLLTAGRKNCECFFRSRNVWLPCGSYDEVFSPTQIYRVKEECAAEPPKPDTVKHRYPQVIFSGPATVVLWEEGVRTFVKCTDEDWKTGKADRKLGYLMCHYMHKRNLTKTQMHKKLDWLKPERVFEFLFNDFSRYNPSLTKKQAMRVLEDLTKDPKPSKAASMRHALRKIRREKEKHGQPA